jgi:acetyl-CoA acetyltransferase
MDLRRLRDKYAIVGIGYTPQGRIPERSALSFYVEASANAIKDAGLRGKDIDGLICYRQFQPVADDVVVTPYLLAQHLGIRPTILSQESYCARGQFLHAISLIEAGFCNYVLISYGDNGLSGGRSFAKGATNSEPTEDLAAFGEFSRVAQFAMAARRAMHEFETGPETWNEIAVNQRKWANLNPIAMMYDELMTYEDYGKSSWVVEPFRVYDCCLVSDGGRACIVTSTERARDLRNITPQWIYINLTSWLAPQGLKRQARPPLIWQALRFVTLMPARSTTASPIRLRLLFRIMATLGQVRARIGSRTEEQDRVVPCQ